MSLLTSAATRQRNNAFRPGRSLWLLLIAAWMIGTGSLLAALNDGLTAFYPFNGNANDASGNGFNGVDYSVAGTADRYGYANSAFLFNGSSSAIEVTNIFPMQNKQTVTVWVNPAAMVAYQPIVEKAVPGYGGEIDFNMFFQGDGTVAWVVGTDDGATGIGAGAIGHTVLPVGQWSLVTCIIDQTNNQVRLYVNGVLDATGSMGGRNVRNRNYPFRIGKQIGNQATRYFNGGIDDVRIYNRVLSDTEITQLFSLGTLVFNQNPVGTNINPGALVTFQVVVNGLSPLSYQWFRNNIRLTNTANVDGVATSSLVISNALPQNTGAYFVVVTNATQSATSGSAVLTVYDGDSDGDGLPNSWETAFGLNPSNPLDATNHPPGDLLTYLQKYRFGLSPITTDSDGDGLTDYAELFIYGTDPLKADTDGDGMPDGWEVAHGLNPRINDANDDLDTDGLGNLTEYTWSLTHTNQLDPRNPYSGGSALSDYTVFTGGPSTNRFYYDHTDRLIGAEYSRGLSIAYSYDGNGNLVRQTSLSRANETNGLPVLWQFLHGLTNNSPADGPYGDKDGDGWSNFQEFLAGTDPASAASKPDLLGLPGTNIAALTLPFTPSNFVAAAGQLDGIGAEEIVIGADGNAAGKTNALLILTQISTGWSTQRLDIGPFGVTSLAIGQVTNRPSPAIYAGLRGITNGSGRIVELIKSGGVWQTNVVANSTNGVAFVLGVNGSDLLVSIGMTNISDGTLSSATFLTNWNVKVSNTNSSHRGLSTVFQPQSQTAAAGTLRLLDSGGVAVAGTKQTTALPPDLVSYWSLDGNSLDAVVTNNGTDTAITYSSANGKINQGAGFNGSTSVIRTTTNISFTDFTFAAWIKTTTSPGQIVSDDVPGTGPYIARMAVAAHKLNLSLILSGSGVLTLLSGATTIDDGSWHFVAGTRNGTSFSVYVDGTLDGQTIGSSAVTTSFPIAIGAERYAGALYEVMNGAIDEVGIWSRALSAVEISQLYGNGNGALYSSQLVLVEPAVSKRYLWRGNATAAGLNRAGQTNGDSVFYVFGDDANGNNRLDAGDVFVTAEYLVSGTNASLLTLSRQFIASPTVAQSYGLASVNYLNRSNEVFFTGEPDGQVFAWTADGSTNALRRDLFSAYHSGYGWHAMTSVKTLEPGEGLAGLRVNPTNPATCNVILWPPQPVLNTPANLIRQTAPFARVLPAPAAGGTIADVHVRVWDAEGDASLPYLQFSPDSTNWFDVTNITQMDSQAWNVNTRLSAPPGGAEHSLFWNTTGLFTTASTNIFLRTRARDVTLLGDWSEPSPYTVTISADSDSDGLPDAWEIARFGNLSQGPNGDPDGDGFTNLQEYLADTDPLDGNSYLRITGIHRVANSMQIDWQGGILATQYLQRRFSIGTSNLIWQDIYTSAPPTSVSGYYQDLMGTNKAGWYRIRVRR